MSWGKMAVGAYKTAKVIVKDPSWVDKEKFRSRMKLCEGCDLYNHHTKRCKECGCYMLMKAKFNATSCPIGKW